MRMICKFLFIFSVSMFFGEAPWDLNAEAYAILKSKIEAKHQERVDQCRSQGTTYFVDHHKLDLNADVSSCMYCQNRDHEKTTLEQELTEAGFQKIESEINFFGHCFGSCVIFSKHLLACPQNSLGSCGEILSAIKNSPNFIYDRHLFSVNQPYGYLEPLAPPLVGKLGNPMHLNPPAMKKFLGALFKKEPEQYLFLRPSQANSSKIDSVAIYAALQKFPNKLLLISLKNKNGFGHLVVVSTQPQKLLFFDPNWGLIHFQDLETLSCELGSALQEWSFRWMASFSQENGS